MPKVRRSASACEETSITACRTPSSTILANQWWRTTASGVVRSAISRIAPARYSIVPMRPTGAPVASRTDSIIFVVVVFPEVPVTPMIRSFSAGRPWKFAAIRARAARASSTWTKEKAAPGSGFSATTALAPFRSAWSMKSCPSAMSPRTATNIEPGMTWRESEVTSEISAFSSTRFVTVATPSNSRLSFKVSVPPGKPS